MCFHLGCGSRGRSHNNDVLFFIESSLTFSLNGTVSGMHKENPKEMQKLALARQNIMFFFVFKGDCAGERLRFIL